ncbi:MAG: efflux RND transporter periplasmic adaptor subunit [Deltaproteobacteria bacterium]|nr:efflux RND transporter periplasmic adaptor subunit [Deltaproteobacteria bacterium]
MKNKKIIIILFVVTIIVIFSMVLMFNRKDLPSAVEIQAVAELRDEICIKHQIPIKECFFCDPALREPERLWCKEHERYEDRCFICRPESKEADRLWCEEHKLYEDECFICRPELRDGYNQLKRKDEENYLITEDISLSSKKLQCPEHGVLEEECGICHPELIDTLLIGQGLKIRLESPNAAKKAGIITAIPTTDSPLANLVVLGKVTYNQNRFARITPLAAGIILKVLVDVGDSVSEGQLLAILASPEIARAKSDYQSALANVALKKVVYRREKKLVEKRISSQGEYEQALAEYQVAKSIKDASWQQLLNYGLKEEQIHRLEEKESSSSNLPILSPFSGTLVSRNAVVGEAVKPGDNLFELSDISSMWIELSVPEDRLSLVKVNDPIEANFDVLPGVSVRGRLVWLSSSIDEQTRMMKARAVVPNSDTLLKHGMFGHITLLSEGSSKVMFVPADALHNLDGKPFVFVKLSDDLYEARRVNVGREDRGKLEIREGVAHHEEIVVKHSFTLKSEFLKSRLGAGCVDE